MSTVSRKRCRSWEHCEITSFPEAIDCELHHSVLSLKEIAERVGVREGYLRQAASQYDDAHRFQAELIIPITAATGNFAIVDYLERALGRIAISLPHVAGRGDVFERTAELMRELGEAVETIRASLTDGRVTAEEAERVRKEIHDVHTKLAALEACVTSQVDQAGPTLRRVG